jgi:hypothetical protein
MMHRNSNTNTSMSLKKNISNNRTHTNTNHNIELSQQERQHDISNKYAVFNRASSDRALGVSVSVGNKGNIKTTNLSPKTPLSVGGLFKRNRVVMRQSGDAAGAGAGAPTMPFLPAAPPFAVSAQLQSDAGSVASSAASSLIGAAAAPANSRASSNNNSKPGRLRSVAKLFGKQILGQIEVLLQHTTGTTQSDKDQSAASKAIKKEPPSAIYDQPHRAIADFSVYTKGELVVQDDNEFRLLQQALRERHARNGTPLTDMGIRAYILKDKLLDERAQRMRDNKQEQERKRLLEQRRRETMQQQQEQAHRSAARQSQYALAASAASMDHERSPLTSPRSPRMPSAPNSPKRAHMPSSSSHRSMLAENIEVLRKTSLGFLRNSRSPPQPSAAPLTPTRPTRRAVTSPQHSPPQHASPRLTQTRPTPRAATDPQPQAQQRHFRTQGSASDLDVDAEFGDSFNNSMELPFESPPRNASTRVGPRSSQPRAYASSEVTDMDDLEVDFHSSTPLVEFTLMERRTSRELDVDFHTSMPVSLERHFSEGDESNYNNVVASSSHQQQRPSPSRTPMALRVAAVAITPLSPVSSIASGSTTGTGRRLRKSKQPQYQPQSPRPAQTQAQCHASSKRSNTTSSNSSLPPSPHPFPRRAAVPVQTPTAAKLDVEFITSIPLELGHYKEGGNEREQYEEHETREDDLSSTLARMQHSMPLSFEDLNHSHGRKSRNDLIDPDEQEQVSVFSAASSETSSIMSRRSKTDSPAYNARRAKTAIRVQGRAQANSPPVLPSLRNIRKYASSRSRLSQPNSERDHEPDTDIHQRIAMMAGMPTSTVVATATEASPSLSQSPSRRDLERYPSIRSLDAVGGGGISFSVGGAGTTKPQTQSQSQSRTSH